MSADVLYEAVFARPGAWTEDDYFALPEMPTKDLLVLVEITSPGNSRQDRIVEHGDYAAGVPFYLRVELENGPDALEATRFALVDGEYGTACSGRRSRGRSRPTCARWRGAARTTARGGPATGSG